MGAAPPHHAAAPYAQTVERLPVHLRPEEATKVYAGTSLYDANSRGISNMAGKSATQDNSLFFCSAQHRCSTTRVSHANVQDNT